MQVDTDTAKPNEPLGRFVIDLDQARHVTVIDRSRPGPIGTWVLDPADSSVSLAWRKLRLWTVTDRLHCFGVIHIDDLPPIGVIRFQQASGLPVLTIALDPASIETHHGNLDAALGGPDALDVRQHRWWTLRSESLEVLPSGTWRVMATLTANGTPGLVELHFEVDRGPSDPDWLVLRGRGVLDRRGTGIATPVSTFTPQIRVDVAVRARRAGIRTPEERGGKYVHNQHAGLSQLLAEQRITERQEQAAHARLAHTVGRPRRRRRRWQVVRGWWQLVRWPATAQPAVHHPHPVR